MEPQMIEQMRQTYDLHAQEREGRAAEDWKATERDHFLDLLRQESCRRLLEIGSGPGRDGLFFKENGLEVTCTDLSPEMVRLCLAKGLTAHVMDFWHLDFPDGTFDAVYALNCLLHVPKADLPGVLGSIRRLLRPGGLFFMGVYGGYAFEGVWDLDHYERSAFSPSSRMKRSGLWSGRSSTKCISKQCRCRVMRRRCTSSR